MKRASRLALPLIVAATLVSLISATTADGQRDKWWWDFGGGPNASHFVDIDQIKKSNVSQLQVAWFYPHALPGFNPIVVDDVMYVAGRNNSLIALDATTGKEIWIHEGLTGVTSRGINYWQSQNGKDRRLIFAVDGRRPCCSEPRAAAARTGRRLGWRAAASAASRRAAGTHVRRHRWHRRERAVPGRRERAARSLRD